MKTYGELAEAGMTRDAKTILYDGRTFGEPFGCQLGVMYMIKLAHMVDDKLHARSVDHTHSLHKQPLGLWWWTTFLGKWKYGHWKLMVLLIHYKKS